jgi:hypothetical protein
MIVTSHTSPVFTWASHFISTRWRWQVKMTDERENSKTKSD